MFLISFSDEKLHAKELSYSLNELLDFVKDLGISAGYFITNDFSGGNDVIFALERIYSVLMYYLDIMNSIYIHCGKEENKNVIRIMVDHITERPYPSHSCDAYLYEDNTSIITIMGGDIHD